MQAGNKIMKLYIKCLLLALFIFIPFILSCEKNDFSNTSNGTSQNTLESEASEIGRAHV